MRTTKRFTPAVLRRFEREGRGEGTYEDYVGQHRVTRGDPASSGRSHLLRVRKRLSDLLSDGELHEQFFAEMLPNLDDALEQKRLTLEDSPHVLADYGERPQSHLYPGTLRLAEELGIKHPQVRDGDDIENWRLSTDHVLILRSGSGPRSVLAAAYKTEEDLQKRRTRELLRLEREYWVRRGAQWLLITPRLYERSVAMMLRRIAPWGLGPAASPSAIELASRLARAHPYASLDRLLGMLRAELEGMEAAQNALWQAVWTGALPIDLRRGWRPHLPLRVISESAFWALNPIAARRSAWT